MGVYSKEMHGSLLSALIVLMSRLTFVVIIIVRSMTNKHAGYIIHLTRNPINRKKGVSSWANMIRIIVVQRL